MLTLLLLCLLSWWNPFNELNWVSFQQVVLGILVQRFHHIKPSLIFWNNHVYIHRRYTSVIIFLLTLFVGNWCNQLTRLYLVISGSVAQLFFVCASLFHLICVSRFLLCNSRCVNTEKMYNNRSGIPFIKSMRVETSWWTCNRQIIYASLFWWRNTRIVFTQQSS